MQSLKIDFTGQEFNPAHTLGSGQVFRWKMVGGDPSDWLGVIQGSIVRIRDNSVTLLGRVNEGGNFDELISRYFSCPDDLSQIFSTFPKNDPFLLASLSDFRGLRLLTQDPWECLISFVCSINCNIPSIKLKIENLSKKFGENIDVGLDERFYAFPTPSSLSKAGKSELISCKLGFRWKYVKFIAKQVERGALDLGRISSMSYSLAVNELVSEVSGKTFGIGPKVADCALLYSFHRLEAFPLDVWILKYVQRIFGQNDLVRGALSNKKYQSVGGEMRKRFGENAGYAQLYLYEKIRRSGLIQNKARA
jgi:N-glycosylase/DNA lyase